MSAEGDPWLIQLAEADRALFTILDSLRKDVLQANLVLRSNLNGGRLIFARAIIVAQLLEVVGWQEARMESKLTHTSEQAEHVGLNGSSVY